jgi:hypothetical protein
MNREQAIEAARQAWVEVCLDDDIEHTGPYVLAEIEAAYDEAGETETVAGAEFARRSAVEKLERLIDDVYAVVRALNGEEGNGEGLEAARARFYRERLA